MKCKECENTGLSSVVYEGLSSCTAAYYEPFYDEGGNRHNHDANERTTNYSCSNGHKWTIKSVKGCWCGWKSQ